MFADLVIVFGSVFGFFELPVCPFQSGGQSPGSWLQRYSLPESSGPFPVRSRQAAAEGATSFPLLAAVTDERPSNMFPWSGLAVVGRGASPSSWSVTVVGSSGCDPTRGGLARARKQQESYKAAFTTNPSMCKKTRGRTIYMRYQQCRIAAQEG